MTAGPLFGTLAKGGRAVGGVLSRLALPVCCVVGLMLMAQGALIPVKAWMAQILLDRAFDQSILEKRPVKPWYWADTTPVARIILPRLGISEIILSGGSGQAMAFGPTLLPISGSGKVSILAAHRDTHFAFLQQARIGDRIEMQPVNGKRQAYRITGFQIVRSDRFAYPRDPARPLLGLATCYPFGATQHGPLRYVAWASAEEL